MTGAALAWMASLALASAAGAQTPSRAELLGIAREVVEGAAFASLATLDDEGHPAVRAMDPLPPDGNWVVWLATNPDSRKVGQLRARPRLALHYLAEGVPAYVTLVGRARLVDDPGMKARHWKDSWTPFYPDRDASVLLIEVTPIRLEVVSEAHGAPGDPRTWRAHVVEFTPGRPPSRRGRSRRRSRRGVAAAHLASGEDAALDRLCFECRAHNSPRRIRAWKRGEHGESLRSIGTDRRLQGSNPACQVDAGVSVRQHRIGAPADMVRCQ